MLRFTHKVNKKLVGQERKIMGEFSVLRCVCIEQNITYARTQMVDVIFSNAWK